MKTATLSYIFLMVRTIFACAGISLLCHLLHATENHNDPSPRISTENPTSHRNDAPASHSVSTSECVSDKNHIASPGPLKKAIMHEPKAALLGGLGLLLILRRRFI
jgi:hypothetical protein